MKTKKSRLAQTNKEYTVSIKGYKVYCVICNRRAGVFNASCIRNTNKVLKNWKRYRKTQWKQK
jgi:hypothetical protein